jgi:hypothetical protein
MEMGEFGTSSRVVFVCGNRGCGRTQRRRGYDRARRMNGETAWWCVDPIPAARGCIILIGCTIDDASVVFMSLRFPPFVRRLLVVLGVLVRVVILGRGGLLGGLVTLVGFGGRLFGVIEKFLVSSNTSLVSRLRTGGKKVVFTTIEALVTGLWLGHVEGGFARKVFDIFSPGTIT